MSADRLAWLPGFFTGRLHAVPVDQVFTEFHGLAIAWSLCGAPAAVVDRHCAEGRCPKCVAMLGGEAQWTDRDVPRVPSEDNSR